MCSLTNLSNTDSYMKNFRTLILNIKEFNTLCPPLKPGSQDKETDSAEISTRFSNLGFSGAPSSLMVNSYFKIK